MHIKQVIIEGFKSYKDQTVLDPFSPKINTVVGANGSGKSNFFHAIRFVLNDIFTILRQEERQKLLHEGAGHQVHSAYVEIVFDNSDGRFPVDKEEVGLRRSIGMKKDEYHLDKKHITKSEIQNFLESAGFSKANPYNVVQQGKVMAMTTMKEHERLDLLKEIGGTKVYEERRKESLKVMDETSGRRRQIVELVEQLEEKLAELDKERAELAKYQQVDKQRRSLEYTIYDKEVTDTRTKLEQLEEQRQRESEKASKVHEELREAHAQLKRIEREVKQLVGEQTDLSKQRAAVAEEKDAAVRKRAKAELDVKDLEECVKDDAKTRAQCRKDLDALAKEVAAQEAQLAAVKAALEEKEQAEGALAANIAKAKRRLQALYQKQGRSSQFGSAAERDAWIAKEVKQAEETLAKKEASLKTLQEQASLANAQIMELSQEIGDRESQMKEREESIKRCDREYAELVARRDQKANERKELWRAENENEKKVGQLREERNRYERHLNGATARDIDRGLNNVKAFVSSHKIEGVFGVLIELFTCGDHLHTAVEVTAGNSLFHVVVDNDETVNKIVAHLNKTKGGRATFMPLNRLRPGHTDYPTEYGEDVVPMMNVLRCKDRFKPALQQIFGKTVICKDMDVASKVAHSTQLNCVTLDGDQFSKKGTLTGGYHDDRRSKMDAMKGVRDKGKEWEAAKKELDKQKAQLATIDQEVGVLLGEITKMEAKRAHLRDGTDQVRTELLTLQRQEATCRSQLEQKERRVKEAQASLELVRGNINELKAELGSEHMAQLSAEERAELQQLNPDLKRMEEEVVACRTARMEVQAEQTELDTLLSSNLLKRRQELEEQLAKADVEADSATLEARRAEASTVQAEVAKVAERKRELDAQLEEATKKLKELKAEQEKLKEIEDNEGQHVEDEAKVLEQLMAKRAQLQQKKADLEKKIRELGSLPADAFEKYREHSLKELHKLLQKCNGQLKKYSHVNQKALDQYVNFTEQREELARRQAENLRAEEKIKQLIETLDLRKDEAIERTFKQVAKNFREIFAELAPGGRAELVMVKQTPQDAAEEEEEGEEGGPRGGHVMEKYAGVKVRVSFGSGDTMSMKQLSGGQKTLVALALIFAIQRCDPAPFYLFDEIDAALDPQYRTTVAKMLARQANDVVAPAQFIITTFHPQIIDHTNQVYGTSTSNRVSRIDTITKEDALEFINSEENRQKAEANNAA
ncbi:hypothetical protein WJX72_010649 [[Myrmecia] bisecta]|uniref:Structural maintenance of chromosomes protein n=1 Tax=[Myrmecia] bisecta TaxID=41462 RepID=A0AAW1PFV2_9CHLO